MGSDPGSMTLAQIVPPGLAIHGVARRFGRETVLDGVSLALAPGEIVAVLGRSGCGKTTLLRSVAGLERPSAGTVAIEGRVVAGPGVHVPPERRGVGMMFQDHALFPHLSVLANVRFGLRGLPAAAARARALAGLRAVGLEARAQDYPHTLSGGQAQRVALARALAPQPRVMLLDEPFSSLDTGTRARLRDDTRARLNAAGTTALLVTHDPAEASAFADRIALLDAGRIVQVGTAEALYRHPVSPFAARALGAVVVLPGAVRADHVATPLGAVAVPAGRGPLPAGAAQVYLRPEAIALRPAGVGAPARVVGAGFAGAQRRLVIAVDGLDEPIALAVPEAEAVAPSTRVGLALLADPCLVVQAG